MEHDYIKDKILLNYGIESKEVIKVKNTYKIITSDEEYCLKVIKYQYPHFYFIVSAQKHLMKNGFNSIPKILDTIDGINQEIISIPVIGQITAGEPILAQQNIEEYIPLPASLVKGNDNFILKVKGESMINAGILNKDYVIVDRSSYADNSQIVVALINGEHATVKRFFKEGNMVRLQPENEFMDPIILNEKSVKIIGIVKGVFRTL